MDTRRISPAISDPAGSTTRLGIGIILIAMTIITINDVMIKYLSDDYPLHQMVFLRSAIGICIALVLVRVEGGWHLLRTRQPFLHAFRALCIVIANVTFFSALAAMPIGLATAIFFVAPLFITLLSVPILGETLGARRIAASLVGLGGVAIMTLRGAELPAGSPTWVLALPVVAALCYALMQVLTAKLGTASKASAMSVYIHIMFILTSAGIFLVAGDGRFAEGLTDDSAIFLLRAWSWPASDHIWIFACFGVLGGVIGYLLSQAYRLGPPATLAPFEYVALPLAMFWGWVVFGEVPGPRTFLGAALIAAAGIYVFWREARKGAETPRAGTGARR